MWPNLYTIRGEAIRFVMPYVESLNKVIALEPEWIILGHPYPVQGKEKIKMDLTRTRDAVLYVHDATVKGMNEGKDVYTLMREISLPPELELTQGYGKVPWGVRSIWEAYAGWFHYDSTTSLYSVPPRSVYPKVVEMAGGANAISAPAADLVAAGQPIEALHLIDMALAAEPGNSAALEVQLRALQVLLERSSYVNFYEVGWLQHKIRQTKELLNE